MKNLSKFLATLPWLLITCGALWLIFRFTRFRVNQNPDGPVQEAEIIEEEEPVSKEQRITNHYKLIRSALPPDFSDDVVKMITAQAMHETGIMTSRLYREQNNLFGMRHPVVRETLSLGDQAGYARFATLEDSIADLLLYFKEFNLGSKYPELKDYINALKSKGYFTAPWINYFNPTRSHYNVVKELVQ